MPPFRFRTDRRLLTATVLVPCSIERELQQKPAGLRTNILIAVGSAAFTLMSYRLAEPGADPARIAAQIVTGIGFLAPAPSCIETAGWRAGRQPPRSGSTPRLVSPRAAVSIISPSLRRRLRCWLSRSCVRSSA